MEHNMAMVDIEDLGRRLADTSLHLDDLAKSKCDFISRYYLTSVDPKMSIRDFVLYKEIGKGAFAKVYFAVDAATKTKCFAMKVLHKTKMIKHTQVENIKSEKRILNSLRSNFIIAFYYNFQDKTNLYLALEYVPGGQLFQLIRQKLYFKEQAAKFYSMQMVLAIEYLHHLDIVYRDIKPENILIAANGYLKLADFGFAKLLLDNRTYTFCGTPEYIAPEIVLNHGYGLAVDWWGIGIFIYELLGGHTPFYHSQINYMYQRIVSCRYQFPSHFTKDAKSLIKRLLEPDLSKRFGNMYGRSIDVKNHKWFLTDNLSSWDTIRTQTEDIPKDAGPISMPDESKLRGRELNIQEEYSFETEESKQLFADF